MTNNLHENIYKEIVANGYRYVHKKWKNGNRISTDLDIAELILEKFDDFGSVYYLAEEVNKVGQIWNQLKLTDSEASEQAKRVLDKYLALCDDFSFSNTPTECGKDRVNQDFLIWGSLCRGTRSATSQSFIAIKKSDKNEYTDAGDYEDVRREFTSTNILIKNKKIPRVAYFSYILDKLRKRFRIDATDFITVEDLDFKFLSPTLLKHALLLEACKDKETKDVIGYRLVANIQYCIEDYFKKSSGYWLGTSVKLGKVVALSNDIEHPSFKYINLEDFHNTVGEFPAWDSFMSTFKYEVAKKVFMAWVYSVFDAANTSPQLLWLTSKGGTGKSSLANALISVLGDAVGTISDKDINSDFGMETILDRRLVINADNKKPSIIHSECLHNLTTGDLVTINRKFKAKFSAHAYAKVLICSNTAPTLNTDEYNQLRRIIYIEQESPSDKELLEQGRLKIKEDGTKLRMNNSKKFTNDLVEQFPYFMNAAKLCYEELCVSGEDVAIPAELEVSLIGLNSLDNEELLQVINNLFKAKSISELDENEKFVTSIEIKELIAMEGDGYKELLKRNGMRLTNIIKNRWGFEMSKSYRHPISQKIKKGVCGMVDNQSEREKDEYGDCKRIMGFVIKY